MEPEALLRKYNPILVLLPQDLHRHRPWSRWYKKVDDPRGDYHPCEATFFLSYVAHRSRPRRWNPFRFSEPALPKPLGLDGLKSLLDGVVPDEAAMWELDLAPMKSQDPDHAWAAYATMLQEQPWSKQAFAYGRYVAGPPAVLEYWYLYTYNDAPNRHEGDWEMVALELNEDATEPRRAGYAGHGSGFVRPWARVEQKDGRPLVYVARGSHAAYFHHQPGGHRANSLAPSKGWMEPFDSGWRAAAKKAQDVLVFLRFVDHTPDNPEHPAGNAIDRGELIDPELMIFPEPAARDPAFWWMSLDCRWGSRHSRIEGTIGPNPPWRQVDKWREPSKWLDTLVEE